MSIELPSSEKLCPKFAECNLEPVKYLVVMSQYPLGIFTMNGDITDWFSLNDKLQTHFQKSRYSPAPANIYNLHPEHSFIGDLLEVTTKRDYIGSGDETGLKCLSNIRIIKIGNDINKIADRIPATLDAIDNELFSFTTEDGAFFGTYKGPVSMKGFSAEEDGSFRRMWVESLGERFSGKRRKVPLFLKETGELELADDDKPFTHIGKFPQIGGHESLAVSEFMGLSAARVAGLRVSSFALVSQGQNLPPMFVTERFDISQKSEIGAPIILMQDFYSLSGEDPEKAKEFAGCYETFLAQWKGQLSGYDETQQLVEMREAFSSLLLSYIINDDDKHAKNFTTLKIIDPESLDLVGIKFAPTFDTVCNVLTGRQGSEMFYKLRSKDQGRRKVYHMDDWLNLLKTDALKVGDRDYGLFETKEEAESYIRNFAERAAQTVIDIAQNPPNVCLENDFSCIIQHDMKVAACIAYERATDLGVSNLEIEIDISNTWKSNKKIGAKVRNSELDRKSLEAYCSGYGVDCSGGTLLPDIAAE
jgi:hypothetical protein